MFSTLPVTAASDALITGSGDSFSKLKNYNNLVRPSISQDKPDSFALLAIENECTNQMNIDDMSDMMII